MFSDIMCIDDILDNPDEIVEIAKRQKYYSCEENPTLSSGITYSGKRTLQLSYLDENLHKKITNVIINKAFTFKASVRDDCNIIVKCQSVCLFHYITEYDIPNDKWPHKDTTLFSGVIYLNKHFKDRFNNHGTKIIKDKECNFEYKYNRMVLYRGDYMHSANFGFGKNIDDSRLTLNFFINDLSIEYRNHNRINDKSYYYELS